MGKIIEPAGVEARQFMSQGSRYLKSTPIYYGEKKIITFDLYNRSEYNKTGNEQVMLITKGVEYRPDLVSYDAYGFVDNWWMILEVNNMKDIWDFKAGTTIILPNRIF